MKEKENCQYLFLVTTYILSSQIDGDGCVFVWKLPSSLSSKIVERIMVKCNSLYPRCLVQPAIFCHPPSYKEEFQQSKIINPDDICSLGNTGQSRGEMLYPGSCHREATAFKFSVSRLPKWAQAKMTSPNIVCRNIDNTSSEVYVFWILSCPHFKKLRSV